MYKIVIVEDEKYAVKRIQTILDEIPEEFETVKIIDTVKDAIQWFTVSPAPDLVFMDVNLADGSCFEIFEKIEARFPIIFVTAFDQYAIQAFKVSGIDYLLKPIKKDDLSQSIDRFRTLYKKNNPNVDYTMLAKEINGLHPDFQKRLLVKYGSKYVAVEITEVAYFYADSKSTFLCTFEDRHLPVDQTLDELSGMLDPGLFFRINRKMIIHYKSINSMIAYSRSRIKLNLSPSLKEDIIVSTDRTPGFKTWLTGSVNE